ncbi:MAG: carboxypeptidase-like regulatory domain-containing protein [Bacteroidales bacterium]|nr:carboxypeptidase-like regulatory domain-containing protein [Bacteroidales bacterium]
MLNYIHCRFHFIFFVAVFFLSDVSSYAQMKSYSLSGVIKDDLGEPLSDVMIEVESQKDNRAATGSDGSFTIKVFPNDKITFSCLGFESYTVNNIKGKRRLDIALNPSFIQLAEVQVTGALKNRILAEPTDIEIIGNYFHIRPRFSIPDGMFLSFSRLIIQPSIYNITKTKRIFLKPIIWDDKGFDILHERMYDFNPSSDPLCDYKEIRKELRKGERIPYHDSAYIENIKDDYRADVFFYIERKGRKISKNYIDTLTIANGTVNPLRFFDYEFSAFPLKDNYEKPSPEKQFMDEDGSMNLIFEVSKSNIDFNLGNNRTEIDATLHKLHSIINNRDAVLQSFFIDVSSSPEGKYISNLALARDRLNSAKKLILSNLPTDLARTLYTQSEARVASWFEVAELMKRDSLPVAEEVEAIAKKFSNDPERATKEIYGLGLRKLVVESYLPQVRKMQYRFTYSINRVLTNDEIYSYYISGKRLSRYEYWRLLEENVLKDSTELIARKAMLQYKDFLYPAAILSELLLKENRPDPEVLKPFAVRGAPLPILQNQILSLLAKNRFSEADSIYMLLSPSDVLPELSGVVNAMNGRFEEAYSYFALRGGLNEVLLLLAMKRDKEAYDKSKLLEPMVAKNEYVKAICANRLSDDSPLKLGEAIMAIENALELDPSLREIAEVDADVMELLVKKEEKPADSPNN